MARPSDYSQDKADAIFELLADGKSMRTICKQENMPALSTVFKWLRDYPEFSEQYAKAKEMQADALFEEVLDIADDGSNDTYQAIDGNGGVVERVNTDVIARSRLRVDARKWMAGKLRPKKYGEKIEQTVQGPDGGALQFAVVTGVPRADS